MPVQCPSCHLTIPAEDVNLDRMVAKCRGCQEVFAFTPPGVVSVAPDRPRVEMPRRIQVEEGRRSFTLRRSWFSASAMGLVVFSVFWNGFMAVWFTIAVTQRLWSMAAAGTLHALVGLVVLYVTAAFLANRTVVEVKSGHLSVRHEPLPWPGARDLDADEVEQFFTVERVQANKNGVSRTYEVHFRDRRGKVETLLKGMPERDQALFTEQSLESFLRIKDVPVEGEVPRGAVVGT
jgi:hypothetical protein